MKIELKHSPIGQLYLVVAYFFLIMTLFELNRIIGLVFSSETLFFVSSVIGVFFAYKARAFYMLFFALLGFLFWWIGISQEWLEAADIEGGSFVTTSVVVFIAVMYYTFGRYQEKEEKLKRISSAFFATGLFTITAVLFTLSTFLGLKGFESITNGAVFFDVWQISAIFLGLLIATLFMVLYAKKKRKISFVEVTDSLVLIIFFAILAILPEQQIFIESGAFDNALTSTGVMWAFLFNILIFFDLVGIILLGSIRKSAFLVNLGSILLFLLIILKYFSFFDALDRGLFFIGAGLLLLVAGWALEKSRRKLMGEIRNKI